MPIRWKPVNLVDTEEILDFWFADASQSSAQAAARMPLWFTVSTEMDAQIRERFGATVEAAARGALAPWRQAPRPTLALVVLLDQFPRNIWRGSARAYAHDGQALAVAKAAVAAGFLARLAPVEQPFLILPFEHDESLPAQTEAVRLCHEIVANAPPDWREFMAGFLPHAEQHREIIERFGRFPHRNAVLGRLSTPDEVAYLTEGGLTFGQG